MESSTATAWQFYPLVASSSLLLVYLAFLVLRYSYSRSKLVQGWTRRLTGKPPKEEKMLLHTLPYYLAITRSSCEVDHLDILLQWKESKDFLLLVYIQICVCNHRDNTINIAYILKVGFPGTSSQLSDRQ